MRYKYHTLLGRIHHFKIAVRNKGDWEWKSPSGVQGKSPSRGPWDEAEAFLCTKA